LRFSASEESRRTVLESFFAGGAPRRNWCGQAVQNDILSLTETAGSA
jgi:hypothetical protein